MAAVGARLRALREAKLFTGEALAATSGVSVRTIAGVELGMVAHPRVSTLRALADGLDLNEAEREALVSPEHSDSEPLSHPVPDAPRQLPTLTPDLVDRQDLRSAAVDYLTGCSGAAVWVVHGPPGVGKSTLAIGVAHALRDSFPGGQLFISLQGGATPTDQAKVTEALQQVLRALGIPQSALPQDAEELSALMRSRLAASKVLVVFDDAPGQIDLSPLIPDDGTSAIIVTSRVSPISLPMARQVRLDALSTALGVHMLRGVVGSARVDDELGAARDLVQSCDHLPVAIRVVASRLAAQPHRLLADAVADLQNERARLDLLTTSNVGVRTTLGAAYQSLTSVARDALDVIGDLGEPFGPTWAIAAALSLDHAETLVAVEELAQAGMVQTQGGGATHSYRVHDLTRIYAAERSRESSSSAARGERLGNVLDRLRTLAVVALEGLPIAADQPAELPPTSPADADLRALVTDPDSWFEDTTPWLLAWAARALEVTPVGRIWPAMTLLWCRWRKDVFYPGRVVDDLVSQARLQGDRRGEATALMLAGFDPTGVREFDWTRECLEKALALYQELGDVPGQVYAMGRLAVARSYFELPGETQALAEVERSVKIASEYPNPHVVAESIANWASVASLSHDPGDLRRATAHARATFGHPPSLQWAAQIDMAEMKMRIGSGEYAEALRLGHRVSQFVTRMNDLWGQAYVGERMAETLVGLGRTNEGIAELERALTRANEVPVPIVVDRLTQRLQELRPEAGAQA